MYTSGIDTRTHLAAISSTLRTSLTPAAVQRNFRLVTMFGFSAILMCSWESLFSTLSIVLPNGGTAGLIWTWFVSWMGFTAVYCSMAEMVRNICSPIKIMLTYVITGQYGTYDWR